MGQKVEFELRNQDGESVSSADLAGKKYVLFFYPKAMTPGCTAESCDFRDSYSVFTEAGYEIVGVSPDPPDLNKKFKEKEGLNFDLLSDENHELTKSLGAWGEKTVFGKKMVGLLRSTFVVDENGELEQEYRNVSAKGHVDQVKADLLGV